MSGMPIKVGSAAVVGNSAARGQCTALPSAELRQRRAIRCEKSRGENRRRGSCGGGRGPAGGAGGAGGGHRGAAGGGAAEEGWRSWGPGRSRRTASEPG